MRTSLIVFSGMPVCRLRVVVPRSDGLADAEEDTEDHREARDESGDPYAGPRQCGHWTW